MEETLIPPITIVEKAQKTYTTRLPTSALLLAKTSGIDVNGTNGIFANKLFRPMEEQRLKAGKS